MNEQNILSVSAFSAKAGVSRQALYKQTQNPNSQIYPFVIKQGKRVFVRIEALKEVYNIDNPETTQETTFSTSNKPEKTTLTTQETTENQPLTTLLIQQLKEQIAELEADKADLKEQVQEKDRIIQDQAEKIFSLTERVAEIAEKAITTTQQQQILTATEKRLTDGTHTQEQGKRKWWQRKR